VEINSDKKLSGFFRALSLFVMCWGVRVDEAFFQGGVQKYEVIKAFGADIFFDDQDAHLEFASKETPSAKVPYKS